jgi:endonuclease III related protein
VLVLFLFRWDRVAGFLDLPLGRRYLRKQMGILVPCVGPERAPVSDSTAEVSPLAADRSPAALRTYFETLLAAYGPQHWWPGRTRFEVIVGAILVQNTAWTNVERAIANLRRAKLLNPQAIEAVPTRRLAQRIRSSGYFRQKAKKLKAFVRFLRDEHDGSLAKMFRTPTAELRVQLLAVHGIGPETTDAILLYAGEHPVFVVDAYARRILERHQLTETRQGYEHLRRFFESHLPTDAALYNEFHALIVHVGKRYCRTKNPGCSECALHSLLPKGSVALG